MRTKLCLLTASMVFACHAHAQTAPQQQQAAEPTDSAGCQAQEAALERDIDLARSRGQMLRRRQLGEALTALQARCETLAPAQSRALRIEKLEHEIRQLRLELDRAEEQLRRLKAEAP